jgi:cytochrome c biogenesis protein CcmG, thiol:disulfide interchange protein DsbE
MSSPLASAAGRDPEPTTGDPNAAGSGAAGGRAPRRARKTFRYGIVAAVVALIVGSVVFAFENSSGGAKLTLLHLPVPQFSLSGVAPGAPGVSPAVFQGPAVVLNFWASWCTPCQAEMPTFQAAHRALGNKVTFVGVDEKDSRSDATAFLRHVGVTYGNGFDGNGAVGEAFYLSGTPTTYFISHGEELDLSPGALNAASLSNYLREVFGIHWSPGQGTAPA